MQKVPTPDFSREQVAQHGQGHERRKVQVQRTHLVPRVPGVESPERLRRVRVEE